MEILEILKNSKDSIYLEDLDFFETELATGNYNKNYIDECKEQIELVKKLIYSNDEVNRQKVKEKKLSSKKIKNSLDMGIHCVTQKSENNVVVKLSSKELIFEEIKFLRECENYKSQFKKYVQTKEEIDGTFVDANYAFFLQWELDTIISIRQMGEDFLEKYFNVIDKEKISRYQCFSESFFMKHYTQLDVLIVLKKGKNEWRKKEKRSKQLDVFLRLKGVKL